jgi:hypothetical protein
MDDWYAIPDPDGFSYGLTKVEGLIVNIIPSSEPEAILEAVRPQRLEVYPNPATDVICLKNNPGAEVEYTIFNVMGKKMASGITEGIIPVAGLGKGVYLLRVEGGKYHETTRFVVR